ncbi:unnamed protein product, partial [Musa acuminata var. zebrina]
MANLVSLTHTALCSYTSRPIRASSNGVPFSKPKSGGPAILELPLNKIRRPLMRTRANDPEKVKELMESIRQIGLQEPIDVLEVDGVYYGFSGCHRFEAHQRLGLPTIRCKVRRGTKETLRRKIALAGASRLQRRLPTRRAAEEQEPEGVPCDSDDQHAAVERHDREHHEVGEADAQRV